MNIDRRMGRKVIMPSENATCTGNTPHARLTPSAEHSGTPKIRSRYNRPLSRHT